MYVQGSLHGYSPETTRRGKLLACNMALTSSSRVKRQHGFVMGLYGLAGLIHKVKRVSFV